MFYQEIAKFKKYYTSKKYYRVAKLYINFFALTNIIVFVPQIIRIFKQTIYFPRDNLSAIQGIYIIYIYI